VEQAGAAAPAGETRAPALVRIGQFFFRFRNAIFPVVFLPLVVVTRPRPPFGSARWDVALDLLGIALVLAGQALRAVVIGFAYIRRGGKDRQVYADDLVTEGVFAHSRNPLYLGNFLAVVGFCLIHGSPVCYLVAIPFFAFAYWTIVLAEEDFLRRRFGQRYEEYSRQVPRFIPSPTGLWTRLSGMAFDWKRLLRKEYGSTVSGGSLVVALLLWDRYRLTGSPGSRGELIAAGAAWLVLVVFYLVVRWAKKSGRLGTGN
jgi:protein-S-isoprenylcysteine O-methyltransferase Ste14